MMFLNHKIKNFKLKKQFFIVSDKTLVNQSEKFQNYLIQQNINIIQLYLKGGNQLENHS